jgi:signal transduction histidine kinase/CheY-like chemotaxis protein
MKPEVVFWLEKASWPALVVDAAGTIFVANKSAISTFLDVQSGATKLSACWSPENASSPDQVLAAWEKSSAGSVTIKLKDKTGAINSYSVPIAAFLEAGEKRFLLQFFGNVAPASETKPAPAADASQIQKQKLDCALQLAHSVSLDFNNVLTSILGHTSLILGKLEPNHPWRKSLLEVEKAASRAAEIANDLGSFSRQETKKTSQAEGNLNPILQRCVEFFQKSLPADQIAWNFQLERKLYAVRFDELKVQQAFLRIIENAVQAIETRGRITIQTRNVLINEPTQDRNVRLVAGAYVCAEVSDTGCGIEPDVLPRIFEPFFTTKRGTSHRGLGLAWVYGIVTNHGGGVAVSSQPGIGTSVRLYLPSEKRIIRESHVPLDKLTGNQTILIVDDEDLVVSISQAVLTAHGYTAVTASNGPKALEILSRNNPAIDLVITDLIMPGMGGRELIAQIQKLSPGMPVICMSGNVWPQNQTRDPNFLAKPFTAQDLLQKIKHALGHGHDPEPAASEVVAQST